MEPFILKWLQMVQSNKIFYKNRREPLCILRKIRIQPKESISKTAIS
mgnify:CR=1 FL=1